MQDHKEDKILQAMFEQQRRKEQDEVPVFATIYQEAKQLFRRKKERKYWILGLGIILALILAFLFRPKGNINQEQKTPILQASVSYYQQLLKEGKIVTNDIHFEYDKASIKAESTVILKAIADMMTTHPELKLHIGGHTDNSGSAEYNQALSELRAEEVKNTLLRLLIQEDRLTYEGFGEAKPAFANDTEAGRSKNRRVEFVLR